MSVLQFYSLIWGTEMCPCNIFLFTTFPYSPSMKYLLTESKRFVRRDLKTPAMTNWDCVLTRTWTESHSMCHRPLCGYDQIGYLRARCVVMTSNDDYLPLDQMCVCLCASFMRGLVYMCFCQQPPQPFFPTRIFLWIPDVMATAWQ